MDSPGTKVTRPATTSPRSPGRDLVRSIVTRFARWRSRSFASRDKDPRHELGWRGEKVAARFLKQSGYKILYRRFRAKKGGEIDLVCRDGDTLVFAEVKTRASLEHGRPYEAVDADKRRLILQGAEAWLRLLHHPDILYRFDIVEVVIGTDGVPHCNVVANAFTSVHERLY